MKIAIIGGGSLGMLFSYYLSLKHDVSLYTRTDKQADCMNEMGLIMVKAGDQLPAKRVKAFPIKSWKGEENLVILAVKQYQLPELIPLLKSKKPKNLLFLQNGYGHIKWLSELPDANIYLGSVEHGAVRMNEYTVSHNGEGVTRAAIYQGDDRLLHELSATDAAHFPILIEQDYQAMLIKKLVVNSVINPLTAVLRVRNGELISNPFYYKIFCQLFEECADVLNLKQKEEYFENVVSVCKNTSTNYSSMYKDIEKGRQTEIDAILGYLLDEAERQKIKAPLLHNYFQCIKGKEHEREGS